MPVLSSEIKHMSPEEIVDLADTLHKERQIRTINESEEEGKSGAYKKKPIPKALREQVWLKHCGKNFQHKCTIKWCKNVITVFDFEAAHSIAEKNGGPTILENLQPVCSNCNKSMATKSIDEWNKLSTQKEKSWFCCC